MYEAIVIRKTWDGLLLADGFPQRVAFSEYMLAQAPEDVVRMGDGIITVIASNGRASYGIVGRCQGARILYTVKSPDPRPDDE